MSAHRNRSTVFSWQQETWHPESSSAVSPFLSQPFGSSLLLERARGVFTELLQLQQHLRTISRPASLGGRAMPGPSVEEIRQRLLARVEQQTRPDGAPRGSLQERQLEQCRYVLATFADEILVNTPWYGRDVWREGLLEDVLFGTHNAGDRIFDDVNHMLRERDPTQAEIATVYLMSLELGFQGRYRDHDAGPQLRELQQQLFMLVFQRRPEPESSARRLIPQAYAHTLDERADRRLTPRWPWAAAIAAVLLTFIPTALVVRAHQNAPTVTQTNNSENHR